MAVKSNAELPVVTTMPSLWNKVWNQVSRSTWGPPIVIFFVIMLVWTAAVEIFDLPIYLLPPPYLIAREMVEHFDLFARNGLWTLLEAIVGFVFGGGVGFLLGALLAVSRFMERGCLPYVVGATTVPIVAFAPLVAVYVGTDVQSKMVIAAIVSFFPLCLYTLKGLLSTDLVQRDLFYSLAASRWDTFFRLQMPTALPYILTAMKQTSTVAVIAAIIAEYIQADRGFGYLILQSSYTMDIPRMWAAVVFSSLMAMSFYALVALLERQLVSWHVSQVEHKL